MYVIIREDGKYRWWDGWIDNLVGASFFSRKEEAIKAAIDIQSPKEIRISEVIVNTDNENVMDKKLLNQLKEHCYNYKSTSSLWRSWSNHKTSKTPCTLTAGKNIIANIVLDNIQDKFEYAIFIGSLTNGKWDMIVKYLKMCEYDCYISKPVVYTNSKDDLLSYMNIMHDDKEKIRCVRLKNIIEGKDINWYDY